MFFKLRKIQKRILEIKNILGSEERRKNIGVGVSLDFFKRELENKNRPLLAELETLQAERIFSHDNRNLFVNITTIFVSLLIAFYAPRLEISLQQKNQEEIDIQSLYQSIISNEDIFIGNSNAIQYAQNNNLPISSPEFHIEFPIKDNIHKMLQREFGIDQYRFLLYFLNQTTFLNEKIKQVRSLMVDSGVLSAKNNQVKSYQAMMNSLQSGDWEKSKLNYTHDTSCILYIFQKSFSFIEVAERERNMNCSSESLNRLFYHFGYISVETPIWLIPDLRDALNDREAGLGDRLIK